MKRLFVIGAVAVALITNAASPARAFVRSVTSDRGTPIFWPSDCVFIQADTDMPTDLSAAELQNVLIKAVANWETVDSACSFFKINIDAPAASETTPDYKNVVKFRTGDVATAKFCRPAIGKNLQVCYSAQATAITTVYYNSAPGKPEDGTIWDADIELNDINFTFAEIPTTIRARPNTTNADLENTLTHELGHFQGLDHTCYDPTLQATAPLDGNGKPIPACGDVAPTCNLSPPSLCEIVVDATMYNYAAVAETKKRTPEADDIAGICAIYPIAKASNKCARASSPAGGCCTVTGPVRTPLSDLLLPFAGFVALLIARKRR